LHKLAKEFTIETSGKQTVSWIEIEKTGLLPGKTRLQCKRKWCNLQISSPKRLKNNQIEIYGSHST
jgi:hypothetical protein